MKLKQEDLQEIQRLHYKEGRTIRDIARIFGVTPRRIQQILVTKNIQKPGRPRKKIPPEIEERIIGEYLKGKGIPTIHNELKRDGVTVSKYKIWRILSEKGVIKRKEKKEEKHSRSLMDFLSLFEDKKISMKQNKIILIGILYMTSKCTVRRVFFEVINRAGNIEVESIKTQWTNIREITNEIDRELNDVILVMITRVPPLVPTRGQNALTRNLQRKGIKYEWVKYNLEFRKMARELEKRLRSEGSDPIIIRKEFNALIHTWRDRNGAAWSDQKVFLGKRTEDG